MRIDIKQSQLDALDKHLGALVARYEIEAAAYGSLGEPGKEIAEQRLQDLKEANDLWDLFLHA